MHKKKIISFLFTLCSILLSASKHVKSNFITGVLKSTWRGMTYREMQGDVNQQGGAFIIGPGQYPILSIKSLKSSHFIFIFFAIKEGFLTRMVVNYCK